jgi:hypothetical protein
MENQKSYKEIIVDLSPKTKEASTCNLGVELVLTITGKTESERARIFEILRYDDYIEALREIVDHLFRRSRDKGDICNSLASSFPELETPDESDLNLQRKIIDELEERFWDILTAYNISL